MKNKIVFWLIVLCMVFSLSGTANAVLTDFGDSGQYFHDSVTNLYWYDPIEFLGKTRAEVDLFIVNNPNWEYGILSDLNSLQNNYDEYTNPQPNNLWSYMGFPTRIDTVDVFVIDHLESDIFYFWEGYLALNNDASIDGEFGYLEANNHVNRRGFHTSSDIVPAPGYPIGAWLKSTIDPMTVPEPSTLLLLGTGLIGLAGFRRKFNS